MSSPARGYSWAPFAPGNDAAVTHGAYSPNRVEPIARELQAGLLEVAAWCSAPAFFPAVVAWSWAEAQCRVLRAYLDEVGLIDEGTGEPRSAATTLDKAERRAEKARRELALTPLAFAHLRTSMTTAPPGDVGGIEGIAAVGARFIDGTASDPAAAVAVPEELDPRSMTSEQLADWLLGPSTTTTGDDDAGA